MNTPGHEHEVDFGIITIRDDEFRAVLQRLPAKSEYIGKRQRYFLGSVKTRNSDSYRVAVARCIEQGTSEAQNVAHDFIEDLNPQWLLVVGIAGGIPAPEFTLGDVVVSTRIYDLNLEAVMQGRRTYALAGGSLIQEATNVVSQLPGIEELQTNWNTHGSLRIKRPALPKSAQGLYGDAAWKSKVKESLNSNRKRRAPQFTAGAIASSNRLIKDDQIASDWLDFIRPTLAIEMESAGIYKVAHSRQTPFIAIRGVSDIVGLKRESDWAEYACHTAASFTFAFLHTRPIEPLSTQRNSREPKARATHLPAANSALRPTLKFQSKEIERLHKQIEEAYERKRRLKSAGVDAEDVDREIQNLRLLYREGGQLREGDWLGDGRYLLICRIDSGGFATVWEAFDEQQRTRVAIKVLHSSLAYDPIKLERFFRGARIMADLTHDSIVRVLEPCTEDGGYYYFVMEYISGGNLQKAVLEKRIQSTAAIPIILRVGAALAHAHARSLVHRDVKPANILLDESGNPRLTDFDLVGGADMTGGTRTNSVIGTPLFAAPELMDHPQQAGPRADVYSLGMTALFCLYGKYFKFNDKYGLARIISKLDCNSTIKSALKKSIASTATARFPDVSSFCEALKKAYELPQSPALSPTPATTTETSIRKQGASLPKRRYGVPRPPRHKLLKAMAQFDREMRSLPKWLNWEQRSRHRYAIEHEGLRYPVKFILFLASGRPTWSFSGGDDANEVIRKQDFTIVSIRGEESSIQRSR